MPSSSRGGGGPSEFAEFLTMVAAEHRAMMFEELQALDLAGLDDVGPVVLKLAAWVAAGYLHPSSADSIRELVETFIAAQALEVKRSAANQLAGPLSAMAQIAQQVRADALPTLAAPKYVTIDPRDDDDDDLNVFDIEEASG